MKKIFVICLFIVLSLGLFAQKIKSDNKHHFNKILWTLWVDNEEIPSEMIEIVKKNGNYYSTSSYIMQSQINEVDVNELNKLEVYKNLYLRDEDGHIYGYDLAKKRPVLIDEDLNIVKYYYEYHP